MANLDEAVVRTYSETVYQLAQQFGSKLRAYTVPLKMKGESITVSRVGATEAVQVNSKYDKSPVIHTPFDVRYFTATEWVWGDMVDWGDDLNLLIDPNSDIVKAGAYAMGREIDKAIIKKGFFDAAREGKEGDRFVVFPDSQKISVTAGSSSNTGLNVEKLIQAKSLFGKADIDVNDPGNKLICVVTQAQLDDLLRSTEVTSRDYNTVYALAEGEVHSFMGFQFVRTELMPKDSGTNIRTCVAYCQSAIKLIMPKEITTHITQRDDYNFNWYAHHSMKVGAGRMEDNKVVHIPCLES